MCSTLARALHVHTTSHVHAQMHTPTPMEMFNQPIGADDYTDAAAAEWWARRGAELLPLEPPPGEALAAAPAEAHGPPGASPPSAVSVSASGVSGSESAED